MTLGTGSQWSLSGGSGVGGGMGGNELNAKMVEAEGKGQ